MQEFKTCTNLLKETAGKYQRNRKVINKTHINLIPSKIKRNKWGSLSKVQAFKGITGSGPIKNQLTIGLMSILIKRSDPILAVIIGKNEWYFYVFWCLLFFSFFAFLHSLVYILIIDDTSSFSYFLYINRSIFQIIQFYANQIPPAFLALTFLSITLEYLSNVILSCPKPPTDLINSSSCSSV